MAIETPEIYLAPETAFLIDFNLHRVPFLNVAQSGYTSTHGLEATYTQFLANQPDWVLIKFGVNDCKQFGGPHAHTLVTLDEYRANLE